MWFAGAYYIKSKIANLVWNLESDNLKISYEKLEMYGFPKQWKVKFTNPTIKFIHYTNFRELSTEEVIWIIDPTFKKAYIEFSNSIKQIHKLNNNQSEFFINSQERLKALIKFDKLFYKINTADNLLSIFKTFKFNNDLFSFSFQGEVKFNLLNTALIINKKKENNIHEIKFETEYVKIENLLPSKQAILNLNLIHNSQDSEIHDLTQILKVNNFSLDFKDSNMKLNGKIHFFKTRKPEGKVMVNLTNYAIFFNNIIPNDFMLPKSYLEKIIANVEDNEDLEEQDTRLINKEPKKDAKLDIEFSERGVQVNNVYLINFNSED